MVRGSNCESLILTRGSDRHLTGNPQSYVCHDDMRQPCQKAVAIFP